MRRGVPIVAAIAGLVASLALAGTAVAASGSNAANAKLCQKGGWTKLARADGTPFTSELDCTSYGAKGGTIIPLVTKTPQTVTFSSTNPSPVPYGTGDYSNPYTYAPTATATSGLPVTISLDSASTGCALTSGQVSFTGVGTCLVDASQPGSTTYAAAKAQQSITVAACPDPANHIICVAIHAAGGLYGDSTGIAVSGLFGVKDVGTNRVAGTAFGEGIYQEFAPVQQQGTFTANSGFLALNGGPFCGGDTSVPSEIEFNVQGPTDSGGKGLLAVGFVEEPDGGIGVDDQTSMGLLAADGTETDFFTPADAEIRSFEFTC